MSGKKILVVLDDISKNENVLNFIQNYFDVKENLIIGVQLKSSTKEFRNVEKDTVLKENLNDFYKQASFSQARFVVHMAEPYAIDDLLFESSFADLLILSTKAYSSRLQDGKGEELLSRLLEPSSCPLVVVPSHFQKVQNIIMYYERNNNSFESIKMFCYLFPELADSVDVTLVTQMNCDECAQNPMEEKLLVEFLKQHCRRLAVHKIDEEEKDYIMTVLEITTNTLVVTGLENTVDADNSIFLRNAKSNDALADLMAFVAK